jgi:hypothetical protein
MATAPVGQPHESLRSIVLVGKAESSRWGLSQLPKNARTQRLAYSLICYLLPASPGQLSAINSYERIRWA